MINKKYSYKKLHSRSSRTWSSQLATDGKTSIFLQKLYSEDITCLQVEKHQCHQPLIHVSFGKEVTVKDLKLSYI